MDRCIEIENEIEIGVVAFDLRAGPAAQQLKGWTARLSMPTEFF